MRLSLVIGLVSLISGTLCAQNVVLPDSVLEKANDFFYEAHRQNLLGNRDAAYELYSHSLELNPESPPTLYELASLNMMLNNDSVAISQMKKATHLAPDNYWYKDLLAKAYLKANNIDSAVAVFEDMAETYSGDTEVLGILEALYSRKQDYKNVVKTLDRIELIEGKSEQLSLEKFKIYLQMKDEKSAFDEMTALADEYPNDQRYRVMVGELLLDNGKPEEALKVFREVEKDYPDYVDLQMAFARYYSATKNDSLYQAQIEKVATMPGMDYKRRFSLIQSLLTENYQSHADTTHIMPLLAKVMECPQEDTSLAEFIVTYLIAVNASPNNIKPILNKILEVDPDNEPARNQLVSYAARANDFNEIIRICKPFTERSTDDPIVYYYLSMAYLNTDSTDLALLMMKKCLLHIKEDSSIDMITNAYSIIAEINHSMGNDKAAFEAYDSLLIYRPEDPLTLNNYAYYLSLQKKDLKRAEQMSALALEYEGDNYTYVDTYAWVLFQQKKYAEAKVYIDSALTLMQNDTTETLDANIYEHAGDIYIKCGFIDLALDYWQKALSLDPENKAIIEKKIKKRKYLEK